MAEAEGDALAGPPRDATQPQAPAGETNAAPGAALSPPVQSPASPGSESAGRAAPKASRFGVFKTSFQTSSKQLLSSVSTKFRKSVTATTDAHGTERAALYAELFQCVSKVRCVVL